ncbi:hypothetical protein [uncultured Ruegeria sp.]|uniref:hypothetical protein n=1 Tax=uncultured Ruegeria sp. TaxID=259304 RepID=UPI0026035A76|nr:hypothetical protein [uncultured Ruegeria sp.]
MFQIMHGRTLTWVKKRIEQTSFEDQPILPALEMVYFTRFSAGFGEKSACSLNPTASSTRGSLSPDQLSQPEIAPHPNAYEQTSLRRTEWQYNRKVV